MRLVFYESKFNRYSITSIIAALEHSQILDKLEIETFSSVEELNKLSKKSASTIFCFSFCTPQLQEISKVFKKAKALYPDAFFIAGGPHPSGDPYGTMSIGFDCVFIGEAEKSFPEFIQNFEKTKKENILKGETVDISQYPAWSLKLKRFSPLEITRGCPFACKFCQTSYLFGTKPRHRSLESILRHVEIFIKHGMRDLRFITPNAFSYGSEDGKSLNLKAVEELLKSIKALSRNIRIFFGSFPSEVRPEHTTREVLELIKPYVSNKSLIIGAQSGSERILEKTHRGHTPSDVYNAVKNALDAGFSVNVDFIFGLPYETPEDQMETVKLMDRLVKLGQKKNIPVKIHSHYFMPLAGTPFANEKPSTLSPDLTKFLGKLYNLKALFGKWHEQKLCSQLYF